VDAEINPEAKKVQRKGDSLAREIAARIMEK
jgi:hypothetical protein